MNLYRNHVLPYLINLAVRQKKLAACRERVVPAAEGRVLEIGIGPGHNLPLYSPAVQQVIGLDPSPKLLAMARTQRHGAWPVELIEGSAEAIPLESGSIDTVVSTWTLCSISDVARALDETRRVLKPGGRLLFVEHGRAPDPNVVWWQHQLTPVWKRIAGGCHLNRPAGLLIEGAGYQFERCATSYLNGPSLLTFMYEGSARPR